MSILDDPMLALIARFVRVDIAGLDLCNESYLRQQLAEIKSHIANLPEPAQEQAALEWISSHAERYRQQWQKQEFSQLLHNQRCDDCPLLDDGSTASCIIHRRWVGLLKEYIAGDINSDRYIEKTLQLLSEHKNQLNLSEISGCVSLPAVPAPGGVRRRPSA